ncbi:unnamed protein product [Aphanomyces euteiches]|uniref:Sulfotransferase domain-containing protein n=1 Tax=Aphanomyces euteiches TaxID=100861 RepID=A0A6G0WF01_9STRA|nr:hypothetical protein Ae201684_015812 [Aphanomyces euteiches]KAH9099409.1 hypothetical protein Ae201684P_018425 [Aphanomyces euteiches]KAH9144661.1 hypothetical protein AeRB84_011388 [Aphanomyces euteiches]
MGSEEVWNTIKQELFALSVQDVYMILNLICLIIFVYYVVCVLLGVAPKEPKPDPTRLSPYSFSHWWLRILLGLAYMSERFIGFKFFAIPAPKLKQLVRSIPREAIKYFGDDESTIALYDAVIDDLAAKSNSHLSAYGRYMVTRDLMASLLARKAFMEHIVANPPCHTPNEDPIIITGLPRTGMNLLYNLLACDPSLRAPRHYEVEAMAYSPGEPPKSKAIDKEHVWYARSCHAWHHMYRLMPEMYESLVACQFISPETYCDDMVLTCHTMPLPSYASILSTATARRSLLALPNTTNVYKYLQLYLQMLQVDKEESTSWLLKSSFHASHLSQLVDVFPKAKVVVMNRDPIQAVPSSAMHLLRTMHPALHGPALDKKHVGKIALDISTEKAGALAEFRAKDNHDIIDIQFDQLIEDPIETVKSLYAKWNRPVSDEFVESMKTYLAENPKDKYGRADYSLEEFGLSDMVIKSIFAKYAKKDTLLYQRDVDAAAITAPSSPLVQSA